MLILQRRIGERVVLPGGIEITVAAVSGRSVRLAVVAPRGVPVLRGEIFDAIAKANAEAAMSAADAGQDVNERDFPEETTE